MFARFQTQLSLAITGVAIGGVLILAVLFLITAERNIMRHYRNMAINSTLLAKRYVQYIQLQQPRSAPDQDNKASADQAFEWDNLAAFLSQDMRVVRVSIFNPGGRMIATSRKTHDRDLLLRLAATVQGMSQGETPAQMVTLPLGNSLGVLTVVDNSEKPAHNVLFIQHDMSEGRELVQKTVIYGATVSALAILAAGFLGRVIGKRFARPIEQLANAARRFGQCDLHHRVQLRGSREVCSLADVLNEMGASLQQYMAANAKEVRWRERMEHELHIAAQLQDGLLPRQGPAVEGIELHGRTLQAKAIGGDFFDHFFLDSDHIAVVIGDAAGKGLPAALLVTECSTVLRTLAGEIHSPKELLRRTNLILFERHGDSFQFVTIFLMVIDTRHGTVRYSSGGHPPPLVIGTESGQLTWLEDRDGLPLGIFADAAYGEHTVRLKPEDTVLLYTDGVSEAQDAQRGLFGTCRLEEALARHRTASIPDLVDAIMGEVDRFSADQAIDDDRTVVALRKKPTDRPEPIADGGTRVNASLVGIPGKG